MNGIKMHDMKDMKNKGKESLKKKLTQHQNHFYDNQIQPFKNKAITYYRSLLN